MSDCRLALPGDYRGQRVPENRGRFRRLWDNLGSQGLRTVGKSILAVGSILGFLYLVSVYRETERTVHFQKAVSKMSIEDLSRPGESRGPYSGQIPVKGEKRKEEDKEEKKK